MAGVPNWPTNLRLSLIANNWLEWSRELINHLKMAQLHVYPLGLLSCPNQHTDRASYRNWRGNDQMVLGYISLHIFPAESQHIDNCVTSAEAYRLLRRRHEQRGGLKQIQLIHQLMQVRFDRSPDCCDTIMTHVRDLVYRIEQCGEIDVAKLACLFVVHGLRSTHPSVHEALSPAIMEGTLTLDTLEQKLNYHYEFEATNDPNLLAFPSLSPILPQTPLSSVRSSPSSPTVALPASFPHGQTYALIASTWVMAWSTASHLEVKWRDVQLPRPSHVSKQWATCCASVLPQAIPLPIHPSNLKGMEP
jgi:hypothetical protein